MSTKRVLTPEQRERERARKREYMRAKRANDPEWVERERSRSRSRHDNLTGLEYNQELLRKRRGKALKRMAEREERRNKEALNG